MMKLLGSSSGNNHSLKRVLILLQSIHGLLKELYSNTHPNALPKILI